VLEFGLVGETMHKVDEKSAVADLRTLSRVYETVLDRYLRLGPTVLSAVEITAACKARFGSCGDPSAPLRRQHHGSLPALVPGDGAGRAFYALYVLIYYASVTTTADELEIVFVEGMRYVVDCCCFR
jgi:hypothetical protein